MSIFNDNITTDTPLQKFHDRVCKWIDSCFFDAYKNTRDLEAIAEAFNRQISHEKHVFEEFEMYNPVMYITPIAGVSYMKFLVMINYCDKNIPYPCHNFVKYTIEYHEPIR